MTRDEILTAAKLRLGIGTTGEAVLTDAVLVLRINEALRKFSRDFEWPWLLTSATVTIATTGLAPLPTDCVATRQVLVNGDVAEFVGFDEWINSDGRYVWTDDGTQLRFDPAPAANKNATLHYYRYEPDLAAGASTPIAPALYHDLIVIWTVRLGALIRRDYELAQEMLDHYELELGRMRQDRNRKSGQRHRVSMSDEMNRSKAVW